MKAKNSIALGFKKSQPSRLVGLVEIITGTDKAKITMLDENKTFKDGSKSIKLALADLPLRLKPNNKEPKQFRIRMNPDGTEVESLGPVTGLFDLEFVELGPRPDKDGQPMPEEKIWNEGKDNENSHWEFWASYKITSGQFKGVVAPAYRLHYKFEQDADGMTMFAFNPENKKATRGQQLIEWGMLHGNIWGEPITWDDETILDVLEERVLEGNRFVQGLFKDGYLKELLPLEDADQDEIDEDVDDEPDFLKETEDIEEVQEKVHSAGRKNGNGKASKEAVATSKSKTKRVKVAAQDEDDDL